jgi:hypothetical protein
MSDTVDLRIAMLADQLMDRLRELVPDTGNRRVVVPERMSTLTVAMAVAIAEINDGESDQLFDDAVVMAQDGIKKIAMQVRASINKGRMH